MKANNRNRKIAISFALFLLSFTCFAADDSLTVRKSILSIAKEISKYKTVDDGAIGYAAEMSQQYKRFISLFEMSTDNELIILTDNKDEKVRVYSFWALAKRKYKDIKLILEKHLEDTAKIEFRSGCIGFPYQVNRFMLSILTPKKVDLFCFKLSSDELKYYRKLLQK